MFSIGQVSQHTGIKVPTIRYYEEIGLVRPNSRSSGNQRQFSDTDLQRLSFIKHSRELGFPIDSVKRLLELSDSTSRSCGDIDQIAFDQIGEVRQKIKQLKSLEKELKRMVSGCQLGKSEQCHVIESLSNHELCLGDH